MITITGIGDHDRPEWMIRITGIRTWFPKAPKIALVQDNLSTHKPASLFRGVSRRRGAPPGRGFEWHYTPKHGSWLNMAETELSVLSGQCLERRIPDKAMLTEEAAAWTAQRNKKHAKADWQFTTADARVKLKADLPSI